MVKTDRNEVKAGLLPKPAVHSLERAPKAAIQLISDNVQVMLIQLNFLVDANESHNGGRTAL